MGSVVIAVLITLSVANGVLSFLSLAALGRIFAQQREQAEMVRLALGYLTDAVASLNEDVEHSLDCLISCDARLDAERAPDFPETGEHAT